MGRRKEWKSRRPAWIVRLSATALDFAAVMMLVAALSAVIGQFRGLWLVPCFLAYYGFCELKFGRTLGKALFLLKSVDRREGELTPGVVKRLFRIALRFVGPLMMLSWHRRTLLDLLSGTEIRSVTMKNTRNAEDILRRSIR